MSVYKYINNTASIVSSTNYSIPAWDFILLTTRPSELDTYVNNPLDLYIDGVEQNNFVEASSDGATLFYEGGTITPSGNPLIEYDIRHFGAVCNGIHTMSGGAITASAAIFTDSAGIFTGSDVGKSFWVLGAGAGRLVLSTTIASVQSGTSITLAANASTTVTNTEYIYGTDDTAAWTTALASVSNNAICGLIVPFGMSIVGPLSVKTNTSIRGLQEDGWAFVNPKRATGLILKPQSNGPGQFYGISSSVGNVRLSRLLLNGCSKFQGATVHKFSGMANTVGTSTFVDSTASFTSADLGKTLAVYGASSGGTTLNAFYADIVTGVTNSTTITTSSLHPTANTVTSAAYSLGFSTQQGIDGVTTASSIVFTSVTGNFTTADIGKKIFLYRAVLPLWGTGATNTGDGEGANHTATIVGINSTTSVNLSIAPDISLTGVQWRIGMIDAIWQPTSTTSQDSTWTFENLTLKHFSGAGWDCGGYQRANRMYNCSIWQTIGPAIKIWSTDNSIEKTIIGYCGSDSIYMNQGANHISGMDIFNNGGNAMFLSAYAQQTRISDCSIDQNEKNGILMFAKGVQLTGIRITSSSQCGDGLYSDISTCRRTGSTTTNLNQPGCSINGCYFTYSSIYSFKPKHCIDAVGPYQLIGNGILYDIAGTSPASVGLLTSSTVTAVHQTSYAAIAGTKQTFLGNNVLEVPSTSTGGLKIGNSTTDLLGFWGATAAGRQTVTGSKASGAALASLLTSLATAGFITDSTSA